MVFKNCPFTTSLNVENVDSIVIAAVTVSYNVSITSYPEKAQIQK